MRPNCMLGDCQLERIKRNLPVHCAIPNQSRQYLSGYVHNQYARGRDNVPVYIQLKLQHQQQPVQGKGYLQSSNLLVMLLQEVCRLHKR